MTVGQLQANPVAKAVLGAFGGVTGISGALLALRSKPGKKLGQKASFQAVLLVVAIVFFLLLSIVISWILLLLGSLRSVQWKSRRFDSALQSRGGDGMRL